MDNAGRFPTPETNRNNRFIMDCVSITAAKKGSYGLRDFEQGSMASGRSSVSRIGANERKI
ncbi:hypothetical protein VM1G_11453 [Cytospora mali]|uniref:Uncharacterized protein n=1 Tax=Cytospora mali TaxID=578113 RepID=A0A194VPR3_CYTMA|nr:hypothetical protein VM1G_11453 [Valsa mali]